MKIHELVNSSNRKSKRLGRGPGSGRGKTSGKGTKGQLSRSGHNIPRRFEGGQSSLIQRMPKVGGFKSIKSKNTVINLDVINKFYKDQETVSPKTLLGKKLIKTENESIKILARGKLEIKVKFEDCLMSNKVKEILN